MLKRKWFISVLLIGSLMGFAGCSEKTNTDRKAAEQPNQPEKKPPEEIKEVEIPKPAMVNIVDPNSKIIIKTLFPKYMGYGIDNEKYKREIEKWAQDLARGTASSPGYDQRLTLDKIGANGQIIKGKPKTILEEKELVEKVMTASVTGGDIELPLYITESGYKPEDVAHLGEVVVGTYTTYFSSGVVGRSKNIELSAQAIHNIIVGSGDIFSFNTTVGPSDGAHGYQKAKEIVNKQLVDGIGGGICQTSSTLFNAVDQIHVNYVEKHHHSLSVGYVPAGRDATVSYGGADFQFKNTTGVPFMIKAIYKKGSLTIEVRTSAAYQSQLKKGN